MAAAKETINKIKQYDSLACSIALLDQQCKLTLHSLCSMNSDKERNRRVILEDETAAPFHQSATSILHRNGRARRWDLVKVTSEVWERE